MVANEREGRKCEGEGGAEEVAERMRCRDVVKKRDAEEVIQPRWEAVRHGGGAGAKAGVRGGKREHKQG